MAHVKKRGNSYLLCACIGYDMDGKQIVRTKTWNIPQGMNPRKAKSEAEKQAALYEQTIKDGEIIDSNIKFHDFADRWFRDYANQQLRPRTIARYKDHMVRINAFMGHKKISDIKPLHLMDFYNSLAEPQTTVRYTPRTDFKAILKDKGLSQAECSRQYNIPLHVVKKLCNDGEINHENAKKVSDNFGLTLSKSFKKTETVHYLSQKTIQNYHRLLSSIFTWAVRWQLITSNPASRVVPPKVKRVEAPCLDEEETGRLLDLLPYEPLQFRVAIELLLYTGMRRGELCGLKWTDIDFGRCTIWIRRSVLYVPKKGIITDDTKNESSKRIIRTSPAVMQLLKLYKAHQAENRLQMGDMWNDEDWVFTRDNGKVINPNDLTVRFKKFITKHDFPPIHLHSLRHTNATLLIASGTNLQTVAHRLGHSNAETTIKIYSHAIKSADAAAAETLDQILTQRVVIAAK